METRKKDVWSSLFLNPLSWDLLPNSNLGIARHSPGVASYLPQLLRAIFLPSEKTWPQLHSSLMDSST